MKLFIFACLVAAAVATPDATADADADPYLLYGGAYYRPGAYSAYYRPGAYSAYNAYPGSGYVSGYSPYSRPYGYRYFNKRSADAEPTADADADPALYYANYAHYGYNYAPAALTYAAAARPLAYAHVAPHVAPHVAYAAHPAHISPSYGGSAPYANYGQYYARSGNTVHIAKRSADAEPKADADADPYLLYNNYYPYARSYNTYNARSYNTYNAGYYRAPYAAFSPYSYYSRPYGYYY